ncbi:MAG: carbon-nitrogen hydrolase family protein [Anaerolineae bacterium]
MPDRLVTVAAAQMTSRVDDRDANLRRAADLVGQAAASGAQLVVLPEMFSIDYVAFTNRDPALFQRAEPMDGPTVRAMRQVAREHHVWLVPSFFEKEVAGVGYDTAVLIDPRGEVVGKYRKTHTAVLIDPRGEVVGKYRKTHIALLSSLEGGQEKFFFKAGNSLPVFDTPLGKLGILICYDRGFPEAWRVLVLQGAEIILVPITTTDHDGFAEMARTRCFENGVFGVFVNRCGQEDWKSFFGGSLIAGPRGELLAQAGGDEAVLIATLNLDTIEPTRLRLPYLRDRRPELYARLTEE